MLSENQLDVTTSLDLQVGEISVQVTASFPPDIAPTAIAHAMMTVTSQVLGELGSDGGWLVLAPLGAGRDPA